MHINMPRYSTLLLIFLSIIEQDQVDTLTFQNKSLQDKAKRFEEALRRSTDEQIVVSLASCQIKCSSMLF